MMCQRLNVAVLFLPVIDSKQRGAGQANLPVTVRIGTVIDKQKRQVRIHPKDVFSWRVGTSKHFLEIRAPIVKLNL